jgi:dipeptidyl aminopeptidase/acylaminoacyl peptidase
VTEAELRDRLLADPVPAEDEAGERTWAVIGAAYGSRERVPWIERHSRAVLALAAVAALGVAAVTPPGRALVEQVREVAGVAPSEPALESLPAPGRLLVDSAQGPWVVQQDGSKRRLGSYETASWSPSGLFVVATQGRRLVALAPTSTDDIRWTVTPGRVSDPRWAPSGFRIAYRVGAALRVVVGDGTNDHLFVRNVAAVAPAWHPDAVRNVLAYVDEPGKIHVVDVDTRAELWSTSAGESVASLAWSADGSRLVAVSTDGNATLYDASGDAVERFEHVTQAAYAPVGDTLAYATHDPATDASSIVLVEGGRSRVLFTGSGEFQDLVWSPNGRWLLVAWPGPDQWLFFRTSIARTPTTQGLVSVTNVGHEFDPGGDGAGTFPRVAGWAPPPSD